MKKSQPFKTILGAPLQLYIYLLFILNYILFYLFPFNCYLLYLF